MSESPRPFSPTEVIHSWPFPELPDIEEAQSVFALYWRKAAWGSSGLLAAGSCFVVPPLPPWPFGGRVAYALLAAKKVLDKEPPSKKAAKRGHSLEEIREFMKGVPEARHVEASSYDELLTVIVQFRKGELTPLSEVTLHGDFGQKIAGTFESGYKLAAIRLRERRERTMLYALSALQQAAAHGSLDGKPRADVKEIGEVTIKIFEDKSPLALEDHAYYTRPSAHLVLECLMNGVHLIHNNDNKVLLRWGEWKKADFA